MGNEISTSKWHQFKEKYKNKHFKSQILMHLYGEVIEYLDDIIKICRLYK